ncbi:MAG: ADP-ribosylation factor-like protein [Candidatus Heimdallarchaeota archaeon]
MVSKTANGKTYFKLTYWGPSQGGKTTAVDKLYKIMAKDQSKIIPVSNFQKIDMAGGSTLFFDRGTFQLRGQKVYFQVYTVAGQKRFRPLRKTVFTGTDGLIFVADSRTSQWEENVDAFEELIALVKSKKKKLIEDYPLIVMLNKRDLPNIIEKAKMEALLKQFDLIFPPQNPWFIWSSTIYETIAVRGYQVTRAFAECARRIVLYHLRGYGKAPILTHQSQNNPKQS